MLEKIKDFFDIRDWIKTLRNVPSLAVTFCVLSSVLMNILANKSIIDMQLFEGSFLWIVQDAGILVSWCGFLAGDLIVRAYGTKTAVRVSITSVIISLFVSLLFVGIAQVPGIWSEAFNADGSINDLINNALNNTLGSVWFVVLGSTLASAVGLICNNIAQGTLLKKITSKHGDRYWGFVLASALSTSLGQFLDNIVFGSLVQAQFFGWGWDKVISASIFGMLIELVVEVVFTPVTYKISCNWKKNGIGAVL